MYLIGTIIGNKDKMLGVCVVTIGNVKVRQHLSGAASRNSRFLAI